MLKKQRKGHLIMIIFLLVVGANYIIAYKIKPNTPIECLLLNIDKIIRKQQNSVSPSFPASISDNSPFLWGDVAWVASSILNQIFNIIELNSTMNEDIVNWFSNLWAYMASPRIRKEYVGLLNDLDIFVSIEKWTTTNLIPCSNVWISLNYKRVIVKVFKIKCF